MVDGWIALLEDPPEGYSRTDSPEARAGLVLLAQLLQRIADGVAPAKPAGRRMF